MVKLSNYEPNIIYKLRKNIYTYKINKKYIENIKI